MNTNLGQAERSFGDQQQSLFVKLFFVGADLLGRRRKAGIGRDLETLEDDFRVFGLERDVEQHVEESEAQKRFPRSRDFGRREAAAGSEGFGFWPEKISQNPPF